jgi:hypothetical protein
MIAGRKAANGRETEPPHLRGPRATSAGRWAPPRREPRPDGRTSWAAGAGRPVNHALPPRPWLARRGSFWRPGHHHHVALGQYVPTARHRPLRPLRLWKRGRKGGITSQFTQGNAGRRPHGAPSPRRGPRTPPSTRRRRARRE